MVKLSDDLNESRDAASAPSLRRNASGPGTLSQAETVSSSWDCRTVRRKRCSCLLDMRYSLPR